MKQLLRKKWMSILFFCNITPAVKIRRYLTAGVILCLARVFSHWDAVCGWESGITFAG